MTDDCFEHTKPPRRKKVHVLLFLRLWPRRRNIAESKVPCDSAYDSSSDTGVLDESIGSEDTESTEVSVEVAIMRPLVQEPPKPRTRLQYALLALGAAFAIAGHWQWIVSIVLTVSFSALSTFAAATCLTAAVWPDIIAVLNRLSASSRLIGRQVWAVVESLISAILWLPDCARDIHLALQELRDVCHTLKCIKAKIAFLPGQPRDLNGMLIMPPKMSLARTL